MSKYPASCQNTKLAAKAAPPAIGLPNDSYSPGVKTVHPIIITNKSTNIRAGNILIILRL